MFRIPKYVALLAVLTTCWTFGASAQDAKQTELKKADLTGTNMELIISITEVRPGESVSRHFHHGEEAVYVLEGATIEFPNGQQRKMEAGSVNVNVREVPHAGFKVVGDKALKVMTVHVVDKGKPLYEPAK
jgi:quercetin dioxygenase-like cupin family protein